MVKKRFYNLKIIGETEDVSCMLKIKDLELLKNIDVLFENKIILYGAGTYGIRANQLLEKMQISIIGFADSDVMKCGTLIEGHKVLTFKEIADILKEDEHTIIIITIENPDSVEQVLKILEKNEINGINCYTYFALKHTIEFHIEDERIQEDFRQNEKIMKEIYSKWFTVYREYISTTMLLNIVMKKNNLLILQPGKVGSKSVQDSLDKMRIPNMHAHTLTGKWSRDAFDMSTKILQYLKSIDKIKIISLIRDPIARGISVYFQSFREYIMTVYTESFNPDTIQGVNALLQEESRRGTYGAMFEWFNIEIKQIFGIDVYQYDFDKDRGCQIIKQDNVELLLIKLENLDNCQDIIGRFVGVENFNLVKTNVGRDKLYRFAYEELKNTIDIPESILDFYYENNKAMDHFYTKREKERFRKKWEHRDSIL